MNKIKRSFAALLALCLIAGVLTVNVSAADISTFPDIHDATVGRSVEVLRTMGVLEGVGDGTFNPSGTLTRAEFCKIAVLIMGKGGEVAGFETRTIFPDVASTHWARGYINLAVNTEVGGQRLILGTPDGYFQPARAITYAEAVTVILRILGYGSQADANWPSGAVSVASGLGLDRDMGQVTASGAITRAQAAVLFSNMLYSSPANSTSSYASTLGTAYEDSLLLSTSAKTADGSPGAWFSTVETPVRPANNMPASFMAGSRGTAVLDSKGMLLTFLPDRDVTGRSLTVELVTASSIVGRDGENISVPPSADVYRDGNKYAFGEVFRGLNRPGLNITVYFTSSGAVDYIFVASAGAISGEVSIASASGAGAFNSLTGSQRAVRVIKNGVEAALGDLRQWDVGVYDQVSGTLYVSDFRLSGVFEDAYPNPYAPTSITFHGGAQYDVLPSAIPDFANVSTGSLVTLLFSPDGKVAGIRPSSDVGSNALGIVRTGSTADNVIIDIINSPLEAGADSDSGLPTFTGVSGSGNLSAYLGRVVNFSGSTQRRDRKNVPVLSLSRASQNPDGALDISARTVGSRSLAGNAVIFEKVGDSAPALISLTDIPLSSVPASKISYLHTDSSGRVDVLILDDVTGDRYTYGLMSESFKVTGQDMDASAIENRVTTITFGNGPDDSIEVVGGFGNGCPFGGAVVSPSRIGDFYSAAGFSELAELNDITQENFDAAPGVLTVGSVTIPIAQGVRCYNSITGRWFDSLEKCLIYSNSFTVYYDRAIDAGAKVRIIVAK